MSKKVVTVSTIDDSLKFPLKLVEKLYKKLMIRMDFELSPENITTYLVTLMQIVEGIKTLKGQDKKNLVIQVMEFLIIERIRDDNIYKQQLSLLVKLTIPELIDMIISIDRKKMKIKIKKIFSNCLCI